MNTVAVGWHWWRCSESTVVRGLYNDFDGTTQVAAGGKSAICDAIQMDAMAPAVANDKDNKTSSRFTIYKVNKASRKKREKSSAKKERKATKTLAIVLG